LGPTDEFTEMFDGKVEKFPMGPRAISLDFELPYNGNFAGIPERTSVDGSIALEDTLRFNSSNPDILNDPYRLFNLDVSEYQANETYLGLYGSIPYLMSFPQPSDGPQGYVGIYWLNAAETWLDLFTSTSPSSDPRRGAFWSSETNILEFLLILSSTPKPLLTKWQSLTGQSPLPPYFSLGYHQSRWSYFSAEDVSNVNFRFDFYELPFDVIWLDIDATLEYQYFTWNQYRFPNAMIDTMYERLDQAQRKIVIISDPHVRKNETYFLYSNFKALENGVISENEEEEEEQVRKRYLVRDPYKFNTGDESFVGNCWPGASVWPDFL